jgi:microcompartment protein CcmK/EutM
MGDWDLPIQQVETRDCAFNKTCDVLGNAIAERPVLLGHLDQVDEDVLLAQTEAHIQSVGDGFVEGALLFHGPAAAQRHLDQHAVGRSMDAEIVRITNQVVSVVLGNDLEPIVVRHVDGGAHGLVYDIADCAPIRRGLPFPEIDANERHRSLLYHCRMAKFAAEESGKLHPPARW